MCHFHFKIDSDTDFISLVARRLKITGLDLKLCKNYEYGSSSAFGRIYLFEHVYSPNKAERQTETDYVQQSHTIKIIQ